MGAFNFGDHTISFFYCNCTGGDICISVFQLTLYEKKKTIGIVRVVKCQTYSLCLVSHLNKVEKHRRIFLAIKKLHDFEIFW